MHAHLAHGGLDLHLVGLPASDNPLGLDEPTVLSVGPLLRGLITAYTRTAHDAGPARARLRAVLLDQLKASPHEPVAVPTAAAFLLTVRVADRMATRYGAPRVFRGGGLVATGGPAPAALASEPVVEVGGFAVMGLGMSVLLPLAFSAVGRTEGMSEATAVSRFTTFTYAGVLLGPAAVGWAAELAGLTWTLASLIPVLFAVALLTRLPAARR